MDPAPLPAKAGRERQKQTAHATARPRGGEPWPLKSGRRHRRRGRRRRRSGGRAQQGRHEGHRARARSAACRPRTSSRMTNCATSSGQDLRPNPKRQPVTWRAQCQRARGHRYRSTTTATRPAAAPCITARCRGACTRTISAPARTRSSATASAAIPEGSSLADWPLSYAELEPYYDAPNTSSEYPAKPAICRARRSMAAISSKRRASAAIRCRRCAWSRPRCCSTRAPRTRLSPVLDAAGDHFGGL